MHIEKERVNHGHYMAISDLCMASSYGYECPDAPWCWNIDLHSPQEVPSCVGEYCMHEASGVVIS